MTQAEQHRLWVTRQALADIGMSALAGPTFELDDIKERHPILSAFAEKRANSVVDRNLQDE